MPSLTSTPLHLAHRPSRISSRITTPLRAPTPPCPTRARHAPPRTFTIHNNSLGAATQQRHARHKSLFYAHLAAHTHAVELRFLALIIDWAAALAPTTPTATCPHTRADFADMHASAHHNGRLHFYDVAWLATLLDSVGAAAPRLELRDAAQQQTCALFARVLCAGEDGTGPRGGQRGEELRTWRQQWGDVMFTVLGREPNGLAMGWAEWAEVCRGEVVVDWLAGMEEEDWEEMYEWCLEEMERTDRLALRGDFPAKL